MKDGPSKAVLGDPDADDFITVSYELKNITPIEDNLFLLCGEGVEPDDVPLKAAGLPEPPAAFANQDQNVAPLVH